MPGETIMLLGSQGQVGFELERLLAPVAEVHAFDLHNLDLRETGTVRDTIRTLRPKIILNAAAYTAVDKAEEEIELARTINAEVPALLAREASALGGMLVHYSTDYVYSGNKTEPYREEDPTGPLGAYGRTKLEGDLAVVTEGGPHLVFRTSWVYGIRGKNFLLTMMRLAKERPEIRVVDDQHGAPTWCRSIAESTVNALKSILGQELNGPLEKAQETAGVYHLTCGGETTWCGFTRAIVEAMQLDNPPKVTPITTAEYPTPAKRPVNSVLDNSKLENAFGVRLPNWHDALLNCLKESPAD